MKTNTKQINKEAQLGDIEIAMELHRLPGGDRDCAKHEALGYVMKRMKNGKFGKFRILLLVNYKPKPCTVAKALEWMAKALFRVSYGEGTMKLTMSKFHQENLSGILHRASQRIPSGVR